jgi:hypothetical protein
VLAHHPERVWNELMTQGERVASFAEMQAWSNENQETASQTAAADAPATVAPATAAPATAAHHHHRHHAAKPKSPDATAATAAAPLAPGEGDATVTTNLR